MPNDPEPPTIERDRSTLEVVELTPANNGVPWTNYEVACSPIGTDPTAWAPPDTGAGGVKGYEVDGSTLGRGTFLIRVRFLGVSPEAPTRVAAVLKVT